MTAMPLYADPDRPRSGGAQRPLVDVAVGILQRSDGAFLLTSRPSGKVYAGYWEFPGGKVESGETLMQALGRELQEELGISMAQGAPWRTQIVDYPHALVQLHFCKVLQWQGELQMREGQAFRWQQLPVEVAPILPGAVPVLRWLEQERSQTGSSS